MGTIVIVMVSLTVYVIYKTCKRSPTDDEETKKALDEIYNF